jgi:hypothetical protein
VQDSKLHSRLKAQLTKFTQELCRSLSRPHQKFVGQMLFGIQARKPNIHSPGVFASSSLTAVSV